MSTGDLFSRSDISFGNRLVLRTTSVLRMAIAERRIQASHRASGSQCCRLTQPRTGCHSPLVILALKADLSCGDVLATGLNGERRTEGFDFNCFWFRQYGAPGVHGRMRISKRRSGSAS